jgi:hypothetical protein
MAKGPRAGRRPWVLAIAISIVFHVAMGWSFYEAGVHWPMARSEPIDTRVPPPIDAVTVDLSDSVNPSSQPAEPTPASVTVRQPAIPQKHVHPAGGISVSNIGLAGVPRVEERDRGSRLAPEGTTSDHSHVGIEPAMKVRAPALLGVEVPRDAQKVVYLVDRSASMGPAGALEHAASAVADSIAALPVETQFQVVCYNRRAEPLPSNQGAWLWQASAQAKATAIDSLHHWRAEGGTDQLSAIRAALSLKPEVIYWLTDGADLTTAEIDSITRSNRRKVVINTIGMGAGNGADCEPLQRVALANRGLFRQFRSIGD